MDRTDRWRPSPRNCLSCSDRTCGSPVLTSRPPSVFFLSLPGRRSMCISEHGPHGPVAPISQKLSFLFRSDLRVGGVDQQTAVCLFSFTSGAEVYVYLGAWTARTGVAHLPEIVFPVQIGPAGRRC